MFFSIPSTILLAMYRENMPPHNEVSLVSLCRNVIKNIIFPGWAPFVPSRSGWEWRREDLYTASLICCKQPSTKFQTSSNFVHGCLRTKYQRKVISCWNRQVRPSRQPEGYKGCSSQKRCLLVRPMAIVSGRVLISWTHTFYSVCYFGDALQYNIFNEYIFQFALNKCFITSAYKTLDHRASLCFRKL